MSKTVPEGGFSPSYPRSSRGQALRKQVSMPWIPNARPQELDDEIKRKREEKESAEKEVLRLQESRSEEQEDHQRSPTLPALGDWRNPGVRNGFAPPAPTKQTTMR